MLAEKFLKDIKQINCVCKKKENETNVKNNWQWLVSVIIAIIKRWTKRQKKSKMQSKYWHKHLHSNIFYLVYLLFWQLSASKLF